MAAKVLSDTRPFSGVSSLAQEKPPGTARILVTDNRPETLTAQQTPQVADFVPFLSPDGYLVKPFRPALLSDPSYRSALCTEDAIAVIGGRRGANLDPYIVDVFPNHGSGVPRC